MGNSLGNYTYIPHDPQVRMVRFILDVGTANQASIEIPDDNKAIDGRVSKLVVAQVGELRKMRIDFQTSRDLKNVHMCSIMNDKSQLNEIMKCKEKGIEYTGAASIIRVGDLPASDTPHVLLMSYKRPGSEDFTITLTVNDQEPVDHLVKGNVSQTSSKRHPSLTVSNDLLRSKTKKGGNNQVKMYSMVWEQPGREVHPLTRFSMHQILSATESKVIVLKNEHASTASNSSKEDITISESEEMPLKEIYQFNGREYVVEDMSMQHAGIVALRMNSKVEIRDRTHYLRTYRECFVGSEAVTCLIQEGIADTAASAIAIGEHLMRIGFLAHVSNENMFQNSKLYYHWTPAVEPYLRSSKHESISGRRSFTNDRDALSGMEPVLHVRRSGHLFVANTDIESANFNLPRHVICDACSCMAFSTFLYCSHCDICSHVGDCSKNVDPFCGAFCDLLQAQSTNIFDKNGRTYSFALNEEAASIIGPSSSETSSIQSSSCMESKSTDSSSFVSTQSLESSTSPMRSDISIQIPILVFYSSNDQAFQSDSNSNELAEKIHPVSVLPLIFNCLSTTIHENQIVDVTENDIYGTLVRFTAIVPEAVVLVVGNDRVFDTVASQISNLPQYRPAISFIPSVFASPLSEAFGWSIGFMSRCLNSERNLLRALDNLCNAKTNNISKRLDRFELSMIRSSMETASHTSQETKSFLQLQEHSKVTVQSWMSIGRDDLVYLMRHYMRRVCSVFDITPSAVGSRDLYSKDAAELLKDVTFEVDGVPLVVPSGLQTIIILNVCTYAGGQNMWKDSQAVYRDSDTVFCKPDWGDGIFEVVGLDGRESLIANLQSIPESSFDISGDVNEGVTSSPVHFKSYLLAQGHNLRIVVEDNAIPMQVDGMPWLQGPAVLEFGIAAVAEGNNGALQHSLDILQGGFVVPFEYPQSSNSSFETIGVRTNNHDITSLAEAFYEGIQRVNSGEVFVGWQAVDWLMFYLRTNQRSEAWQVGQMLMQAGVFSLHSSKKKKTHSFIDANIYYRIATPSSTKSSAVSVNKRHLPLGSLDNIEANKENKNDLQVPLSCKKNSVSSTSSSVQSVGLAFLAQLDVTVVEALYSSHSASNKQGSSRNDKIFFVIDGPHETFKGHRVSASRPVWNETYHYVVDRSDTLLHVDVFKYKTRNSFPIVGAKSSSSGYAVKRVHGSLVGTAYISVSSLNYDGITDRWYDLQTRGNGVHSVRLGKAVSGRLRVRILHKFIDGTYDAGTSLGFETFQPPGEPLGGFKGPITSLSAPNHSAAAFNNIFISTTNGEYPVEDITNVTIDYELAAKLNAANPYYNTDGLVVDKTKQCFGDTIAYFTAKFEYFLSPMIRESVRAYAKCSSESCGDWIEIHAGETDSKGLINVPLPGALVYQPTHIRMRVVADHDHSMACGSIFVVAKGTPCVVFDIDGTLTVGDQEVVTEAVKDVISVSHDSKLRTGAVQVVRLYASKGYLPLYVSGRAGSFFNLTRDHLVRHGFPPGPIHLTNTHTPTLPIYQSVGLFKKKYLKSIQQLGLDIAYCYGNRPSDLRAYQEAGIDTDRIFLVGMDSDIVTTLGKRDFVEKGHLSWVAGLPDAKIPTSRAALEW